MKFFDKIRKIIWDFQDHAHGRLPDIIMLSGTMKECFEREERAEIFNPRIIEKDKFEGIPLREFGDNYLLKDGLYMEKEFSDYIVYAGYEYIEGNFLLKVGGKSSVLNDDPSVKFTKELFKDVGVAG
jgi:hypothetical protein